MKTLSRLVVGTLLGLLTAMGVAHAAAGTSARVEVSLAQTAAANPAIGANEFGDPGGTAFSAGNIIPDSGFEPLSMRCRVRVSRCGTENGYPWFEFDENGGIDNWELTTTGLYNGASARIYRLVDAQGQPLPDSASGNYLDLTNAAGYAQVGTGTIPDAGVADLPVGGWVDSAYKMPSAVFGTRASLSYTDARWVENGKTYYYIVTAIGSNTTDDGGAANESDPATAVELTATPQAGLASSPHIYAASGNGLNEIGSVGANGWFSFRPSVAGATGTVTWALLNTDGSAFTLPSGWSFNASTGELSVTTSTTVPAPTTLRFRATASNGTATRDFILNNPMWTATGGTTRPQPPTNVTAVAGDGYVHLSWSPSPTAGVVGYRVYRAELPRTQQRQRVYLSKGAPALHHYDYVHIEKRIMRGDPIWAHPRVRTGTIGETWDAGAETHTDIRRVAHPGTLPAEFKFPGDSCLQITATVAQSLEIGGPYIFYPDNPASGESEWYSQLEPGKRYRYEAWMRQSGLGNGGQVALSFNQYYEAIAHTFTVDGEWRLCSFEFTAPARPTTGMHSRPVFRITGPGTLWVDNIRLFRADNDADLTATIAPPSPLVFDEQMASQPATGEKGMLRSMSVLLNKASMASNLSLHRDASLTMNWYQSASSASNMTLPVFLSYALRTGSSAADRMKPWLNVSSNTREDEWLALIEYLGAPINPNDPADVAAKPWAYLRYQQRGVATPWTDEFARIYIEFANETWHNGAVSDEWFGWSTSGNVHGGAFEFGLAAHYITSYVRDHSASYGALNTAGKLRFVMGSNYTDYAETGAAGAPLAHAIGHTSYVGPKWEVGETPLASYDDHGIQATLLGHAADTALGFANYRRQREELAAAGHTMDLLGYEGGPSGYALPGEDASADAHEYSERYGKSLAMGVAALDAWLAAYEAGFSDQGYLSFGIGDYWSSHTQITQGYRAHAGWLALRLRNRYASGRMIRSEVVQSPDIVWDGATYPLVSSYAFRDGKKLCVFLLSRKLAGVHDGVGYGDGSTPVTLVLPATPTGQATLYALTGDPRATNRTAQNVSIQQSTVTLSRETTVTLPQGSIYLYVVETDLPDRDDPLPPPASVPTLAYAATGTTLSWPAVPGATGYSIYRSAKPYFDRADVTETFTSTTNRYLDTGAVGGSTYYYRVAANNGWGAGFWTLVATGGKNPAAPVLPAPALAGLMETTGALVANWSEVPEATGYYVGISTKAGGPYTWSHAGIATSWTFSGLTEGQTYYVQVYAEGPAGRGPASVERNGSPLVSGQSAVLAAWDGVELNYSADLDNPPLQLSSSRHVLSTGASALTRGSGFRLRTTSYGFSAGTNGTGHYDGKFPFSPADGDDANFGAAGGGSLANAISRDLYVGVTLNPAPGQVLTLTRLDTGFQYSYGSQPLQVALRYRVGAGAWHEVPATGYSVTPGYWIYNDLAFSLSAETALQNVSEPVELRLYIYSLGTSGGWHPASLIRSSGEDLIVYGTTQTVGVPGQPQGLRAAAGVQQATLAWTPAAGAESYTLRWGTTAGGPYTESMTGLTQASANVTALSGGVPYYFVVEALNGLGASVASAEASATPATSPLVIGTQPAALTVTAGETATFTVAASGSGPLSYRWQRSTDGGNTWGDVAAGGAYAGVATARLTISPTTGAMRGDLFRCVLTDGFNPAGYTVAVALTVRWSQFAALSARALVGSGAQTLILGYVFAGGAKPALVRGVGPGIGDSVPGYLRDPALQLYRLEDGAWTDAGSNNDWGGTPALSAAFAKTGAGPLAGSSLDAALLSPASGLVYTAHVVAPASANGVVLAEAYDADFADKSRRLTALSVRNTVGTDDSILIAGFVIAGDAPKRVIVRGVGPAMAADLPGRYLADPQLQIWRYDSESKTWALVAENDNWGGGAALASAMAAAGMGTLASGSADAAVLVELEPGIYTAQVRGAGGTTGIGLAEIYEAP